MKVIDTSAIAAVLFDEPGAATIEEHMLTDRCVMSAATLVDIERERVTQRPARKRGPRRCLIG